MTYQPDTPINGLTKYPIASFVWSRKKNSARGLGEVVPLINNQIQENKLRTARSRHTNVTLKIR